MMQVTKSFLEMNQPREFKPSRILDDRIRVVQLYNCTPSFYRYLYQSVGRRYHWVDRVNWTDEDIRFHLINPNLSLCVMYYNSQPAGYFELLKYEDGSTEIAYFGLLPDYIGRGLGKHLLTIAVEQAWRDGAERLWLHTCSLDDPAALPNYLKRGFKLYKHEVYTTSVESSLSFTAGSK
jgi:ribosomal protein S18 acetylase RimI-like enzyme